MGDLSYEKFPKFDDDPRGRLSDEALDEASRNAFPVVANSARRNDRVGLLVGGGIAIALGALTFTSLSAPSNPPLKHVPIPALNETNAPEPAKPAVKVAVAPVQPGPAKVLAPTPAQLAVLAKPPADLLAAPAQSAVMVYDTSIGLSDPGAPARVGGSPSAVAVPPSGAGLNDNEVFGSRVGSAAVDTASATRLADPANTVTQGTLIPAILETAIDSDLPGYVRAVVSQDVRSFDGKNILVPRSSRLIGQYKSGLAAGQTRAYVIWIRLIRPDGVSVALGSPAIEYSGRTGLSGEVDGHFMKRFGAASLLSVIGSVGALAGGLPGLLVAGGASSTASVAAQRDAQIPPTIRVSPGQPVRVFTARDLDFSTVAAGVQ